MLPLWAKTRLVIRTMAGLLGDEVGMRVCVMLIKEEWQQLGLLTAQTLLQSIMLTLDPFGDNSKRIFLQWILAAIIGALAFLKRFF